MFIQKEMKCIKPLYDVDRISLMAFFFFFCDVKLLKEKKTQTIFITDYLIDQSTLL